MADALGGGGFGVHDGPGGRALLKSAGAGAGVRTGIGGKGDEEVAEPLYDVVVIGGWTMGDNLPVSPDPVYPTVWTVNDPGPIGYGEFNHHLAIGQTRGEIERQRWTWPPPGWAGNQVNAFAIIMTPHGTNTELWLETFPDQFWNNLIPRAQVIARRVVMHRNGTSVTLGLKLGVIEG